MTLKEMREERGITVQHVAMAASNIPRTIERFEAGEAARAHPDDLDDLVRVYARLMGEDPGAIWERAATRFRES